MGQGQQINFFFPLRVASYSVGPRGDFSYWLQTYRTFLRNCEDGVISNDDHRRLNHHHSRGPSKLPSV